MSDPPNREIIDPAHPHRFAAIPLPKFNEQFSPPPQFVVPPTASPIPFNQAVPYVSPYPQLLSSDGSHNPQPDVSEPMDPISTDPWLPGLRDQSVVPPSPELSHIPPAYVGLHTPPSALSWMSEQQYVEPRTDICFPSSTDTMVQPQVIDHQSNLYSPIPHNSLLPLPSTTSDRNDTGSIPLPTSPTPAYHIPIETIRPASSVPVLPHNVPPFRPNTPALVRSYTSDIATSPTYPPSAIVPTLNYILGLDGYSEANQYMRPKSKTAARSHSHRPVPPEVVHYPSEMNFSELSNDQILRHHSRHAQQKVELQRILQSLPPTFPLTPQQPSIPQLLHEQEWQESTPLKASSSTPAQRSSQIPHYPNAITSNRYGPPGEPPRRDALLWKLFVPQPPVAKGSASSVVLPLPPHQEEATPPKPTDTTSVGSASKGRLLIVVRRLPDIIVPYLKRRPSQKSESGSPFGCAEPISSERVKLGEKSMIKNFIHDFRSHWRRGW